MFLSVLAVTAIVASSSAPSSSFEPARPALAANSVILDCQVAGAGLTDCHLVDGVAKHIAAALQLAAKIQLPTSMAEAGPSRIRVKLDVNP